MKIQTKQKPKQTKSWCVYWPLVFTKEETKHADWMDPEREGSSPCLTQVHKDSIFKGMLVYTLGIILEQEKCSLDEPFCLLLSMTPI